MLLLARVATAAPSTLTCGGGHTGRHPGARSLVLTATLVVVLTSDIWESIVGIAVFTCRLYVAVLFVRTKRVGHVKVILPPTVSRPVSPGVGHHQRP
jgi:hypothetical protein